MKKLTLLLLVVTSFSLTGCFDILEEIRLNKNGTGSYTMTFDMSSLMSDPFMKSMLQQAVDENPDAQAQLGNNMEKDTMMYMRDMIAASGTKISRPEVFETAKMQVKVSEKESQMFMTMSMDFKNVEDIDYFLKNMGEVMKDAGADNPMPTEGLTPTSVLLKLGKKSLQRMPTPKADASMGGEDMEMMKMFLSAATYTTVYQLPGKVKKANIPNATVEGNTVTVTNSLVDIMDGKAKMDGEIKFK